MISVNTNLKNAITGKGSQLVRIYGACYDTSDAYHTFTWTNADIVQGSFYVDKRCVSGSQFSFGNTVSNELGFEIFGSYEDWLLEGVTVMVELGGYVSGTATYFELGKFVLDKPVQKLGRLTFRGYDDLTKLDQNADNWVLNTNSGENILGQAIKPHPQYYMNADGYYNYIRGIVTAPYYASDPLACSTGMVPLSQNGHYPRKIVIKATGNTVDLSASYFMLFYYNGGSLEVVSGFTWRFDLAGYYASSTVSAGEYHITFDVATGSNKTKFQEYLETQYGENNYFILFTLMTSTMANLSDVSISYGGASVAKIGDTVAEICAACGLKFFAGYPAPYNLTEEYTPLADYSQYSYRTVLGLFAKACGANLTLWPSGYGVFNGDVRFAVPTATDITLTESDVLSCDLADEPVLINGTRFVSSDGALFINRTDNTEPYKYFDFTGCPVFPKDAQTAVDNLSALTGSSMTWLPGQAKILAQPWLEPMDVVNFAYTKAPNYAGRFMITRVRINAMGSTYIESAGFVESTNNSNGYVATDYTPVDPFGVVYSNYNETIVPGLTSNVPMASFTKNLPTVNDYVIANSGFGIVTDINGSFATVEWLAEAGGGGGGGVTYAFTGGTQSFTAEDSLGNTQSVAIKPQIFKGTCSTAAGTTAKDVTCPEFTSADLVTGAVIFVTFSATNSGAVASITLNVNGTGAKNIKYMRNAAESNLPSAGYLRANMTYRFVYNGTYWVCDTDYDANTVTDLTYRSFRVASDAGGSLYSYKLCAVNDNGDLLPFNFVSSSPTTNYKKAITTHAFNPYRGFLYYSGTTTTNAGNVRDASEFKSAAQFDCRYSLNIYSSGTAGSTALTAYDPVYVKALYTASTRLATLVADVDDGNYLVRSSIVQALPSTNPNTGLADGTFYIYILLGQAYSKYQIDLFDNNTVFYWNSAAGKTTEFSGIVESNNITGTGTSGSIAKFSGTNTITSGPAFGSSTTTFLRNDGTWASTEGASLELSLALGAILLLNNFNDYPTTYADLIASDDFAVAIQKAITVRIFGTGITAQGLIFDPMGLANSNHWKILLPDGIMFNGTLMNGIEGDLVYYSGDGWIFDNFTFSVPGYVDYTDDAISNLPIDSITYKTSDQYYGWTPDATPSSSSYTVTGTCAQGTYSDIMAANAAGKAVFVIDDAKIFDYYGCDDVKVYELVCANSVDGLVTLITSQDAANYLDEILTVHSTDAFDLRDKLPAPHTHVSTQIEANATEAAAVESGDALIFADSNDSNKLKRMTSGFDVSNTTSYLCKNGTWSIPAGESTAGIFKGTCATGAGGDPKAVTCPEFTSSDLVKGAVIFVTFSYTNSVSVNTVQMNVNGTGAKRIMQRKNTVVGTLTTNGEILADQTYMFTYDGTYWVLVNDDDQTNVTALGNGLKNIGTTNRYQFLVSAPKDDTNASDHKRALFAVNAVDTGSTVYTKAFRTWSFDPFGIFAYWNSADRVSSEGTFADPTRLLIEGHVAGNYAFNVKQNGTAGTQGFVDNKAVYMKSKYDFVSQTATLWQDTASDNYLDRSGLVQELPTTNPNTSTDTYIYIYLGQAYSGDARTFYLLPYHPVYMWNNAKGAMDLFTGAPMDGNGTFTLTDNMGLTFTANYYKIGRQVTVWGTIPKVASTALILGSLPFAASAKMTQVVQFARSDNTARADVTLGVSAGATDLEVYGYLTGSSDNGTCVSSLNSWLPIIPTAGLPFNFTYITDA